MGDLTDDSERAEELARGYEFYPEIGHNNPPKTILETLDDLYTEAKNWIDGTPIETDEQARELDRLMGMLSDAWKAGEAERKEKVAPFDKAKKDVQAVYVPVLEKADTALKQARVVGNRFLAKKQAALDEAARVAREKAAEEKRIADEAIRASRGDLHAREEAEELLKQAKRAEAAANAAAKATPASIGGRKTVSKKFEAVLTDPGMALNHYYITRPADLLAIVQDWAGKDVNAGVRNIPGFHVKEQEI